MATTQPLQFRGIGVHLVPFLVSVVVYFVAYLPTNPPTLTAVLLKCAPIVSLMYFVVAVGQTKNPSFTRRIFVGLIFGSLGDILIFWNKLFIFAMLAFLAGHISYIQAFQLKPLKPRLGLVSYCLGIAAVAQLYPGLTGVLLVGVPIYGLVINSMIWRAAARVQTDWTWIQVMTAVGGVLFAISDFIIGINKFLYPIPQSQLYIMVTYYAAQFGIALSVLEPLY